MSTFRFASAAIALLSLFSGFTAARAQRTIHVPADEPTIQAGIDMANDGDTVLIAPGTYPENIDFKGKAITVTSSGGAATTIIDGGGKGTAVTFKSGEPRAAVLSNLTLTHGGTVGQDYDDGPGVQITDSAPTLLNNVITQNYCQNISINGAAPLIQGNEISSSLNPEKCGSLGAGIYIGGGLDSSYPAASNGTSAQIIGNTIANNTTGRYDGGGDGGGGIAIWGSGPTIQGNIIRNNTTISGSGGAINIVYGENISIVQNLIYGNTGGCGGGAIGSEEGSMSGDTYLLIANNTIVEDTGSGGGGYTDCRSTSEIWTAFYNGGGPSIKFVNNVFYADLAPALDCGDLASAATANQANQSLFDHNLLYDSAGSFFASNCFDTSQLNGNLVADPQFVNLSGFDFHLKSGSPAIDAGNGSVLAMLSSLSGVDLTKDFDGNAREQDATGKGRPIIDMGAYEFTGQVDGTPTRVVLSSSAYTGPAAGNFTLTATLSSGLGVPGGSADFFMDGQQIGTANIVSGVAVLNNVLVKPGVHVLYASYAGQGSYEPAISVVIVLDIDLYTSSLTMTSSPNPSLVGQAVQFSVHATSADPDYVPTPITIFDQATNASLPSLTPDASGNASFSISTLALGGHDISAAYAGDSQHASTQTSVFQQVTNGYSTTTTLRSSLNPSTHNQLVTFTAQVTSTNGTPTGSVQFTDGTSTVLGSVALDQSGSASFSISTLAVGQHTITATYGAATTFSGSSGSVVQQVNGLATTAVLTANPATILYGNPVTLAATVTAGTGTPTGGVSFYDDGTLLGTATLGGSGVASITVSTLHAGGNGLTCAYAGDAVYSASVCPAIQYTVQAADSSLTLTASAEPVPALTPVTFTARLTSGGQPNSGAVQIYVDGNLAGGGTAANGTTTAQVALNTGSHIVTAKFAGSAGLNASSAMLTEVATVNATTTALSAPTAQVYQNQSFGMGVGVTALTGTARPYGVVTLLDGATVVSSLNLAAGQGGSAAAFTVAPLTAGIHLLTAMYTPGDGNFTASSSAAVMVTVLPQTFTLTPAATSMTIRTEYHGAMELTLSSVGDWKGPVRLSCGLPLPTYVTCELTPSLTLAGGDSISTTLKLDTDELLNFRGKVGQEATSPNGSGTPVTALAGLLLPVLCLGLRRRVRGRLPTLFLSLICMGGLAMMSGCSGHYPGHTPPGTYNVLLTATGTSVGATAPTTQTVELTLVVTP